MTTNEREAFEKWATHVEWLNGFAKEQAFCAWQARAALDQRQEVTYSMLDTIVELACQFKNDEIETVDEFGTRLHAALQSIAKPVKVPNGWKLVPIAPDDEMSREGASQSPNWMPVWRRMINASPEYKP